MKSEGRAGSKWIAYWKDKKSNIWVRRKATKNELPNKEPSCKKARCKTSEAFAVAVPPLRGLVPSNVVVLIGWEAAHRRCPPTPPGIRCIVPRRFLLTLVYCNL